MPVIERKISMNIRSLSFHGNFIPITMPTNYCNCHFFLIVSYIYERDEKKSAVQTNG